ncbi:type I DNA topoisomerase [Candidatus Microgenomates bacterium]|nr:type I DNA topoisomerase [Candidatus Microgenomates bacterium]
MENLIIVESPTKARTLSRFLGKGFQIEATIGHVRDLPKSELGVDVEHDFEPRYVIPTKKRKTVNLLKNLAKESKKIILATDPDREGEAIAYHVMEVLGSKGTFSRVVFHEITERAVKEALNHPRAVDLDLVNAQQARRVLDRLVGYKLSPLLWQKIQKKLSAGRVQSVALRLIVEREREIEAFKAEEYWEIEVQLYSLGKEQEIFSAQLTKIDEEKAEIKGEAEAKKIKEDLEGITPYLIDNVEIKDIKRQPPAPFMTSSLQQAAGNAFFWPTKKTMLIAQKLYEEGVITYHRTDSLNLAQVAVSETRDYVQKNFGANYLPEAPRVYKTKSRVAQEAHEAIRPTLINTTPSLIQTSLGRDEGKLYELIWKRMLASQMQEAVYEQLTVEILGKKVKSYRLRASGSEVKFDGWQKLYEKAEMAQKLPELKKGEKVNLKKPVEESVLATQHFTEPPARFTEASLVKALEEQNIGRPSTYAPIISTIQEREYVEKIERKFQPTKLGFAVNDFLVKYFPQIDNVEFTAQMEEDLDSIARGEGEWVKIIRDFYGPFEKHLEYVAEVGEKVTVEQEKIEGEKCEKCGAPLVLKRGKYGKFLACSRFPDCDFTKRYQIKTDIKCPQCGGDVVLKKTRKGGTFYGCSNWPNCKFASWKKPQSLNDSEIGQETKGEAAGK